MSPPQQRGRPAANGPARKLSGHHNPASGNKATSRERQATLFDAERDTIPADPLEQARVARDVGAQAAELSLHTGWRLWAETELARLADSGEPFTADALRAVVGDPPDGEHVNGIGGLFLRASKAGRIEFVGYAVSQRPAARGRPIRVWRGAS